MRYILLLAVLVLACGEFNKQYQCTAEGRNCERADIRTEGDDENSTNGGREDGESNQGVPGPRGQPGIPGPGCTITQSEEEHTITIHCGTEEVTIAIPEDGSDGEACTVESVINGALIICGDTQVVVLNGTDGEDAPPTAYTVTDMYDPCGDGPGFDEVLLHLANGEWMAHYAGGGNLQFLTVLGPGNYVTTDSQSCHFTIDSEGSIVD